MPPKSSTDCDGDGDNANNNPPSGQCSEDDNCPLSLAVENVGYEHRSLLSSTVINNQHNQHGSRPRSSVSAALKWDSIVQEITSLWNLMIPTVIIQMGFSVCPFLTASYVGRTYGSVYLDGLTLAFLTGNLSTLSLLQGLFSASDTLSPQAYGAGNHVQVGLLAIRGFVVSMSLVLPINVALAVGLAPLLEYIGQDPQASQHAQSWYRVYIWYLPFYALYGVTWKFLSAQSIMTPLLVVCAVSVCVVLPLSLEYLTNWFGFLGSAMAVVSFQMAQAVLVLLYLYMFKPHAPTTWPSGLLRHNWKDAIEWGPYKQYMLLGVGGILMSCEWIYWECISLMIGTLGVIPLSVHTVATQVITVCFMVPLGCGIALAVRLGQTLPASQGGGVHRAQLLAASALIGAVLVFGTVAWALYRWRYWIYGIFINPKLEPQVWEGCDKIWSLVTIYYFNIAIFGINMGIATALGMQWTLGFVCVLLLWVLGFPASWYFAHQKVKEMSAIDPDNDGTDALVAAWQWINPAYYAINVVLLFCFLKADWHDIRRKIRQREGVVDATEWNHDVIETALVSNTYGSLL